MSHRLERRGETGRGDKGRGYIFSEFFWSSMLSLHASRCRFVIESLPFVPRWGQGGSRTARDGDTNISRPHRLRFPPLITPTPHLIALHGDRLLIEKKKAIMHLNGEMITWHRELSQYNYEQWVGRKITLQVSCLNLLLLHFSSPDCQNSHCDKTCLFECVWKGKNVNSALNHVFVCKRGGFSSDVLGYPRGSESLSKGHKTKQTIWHSHPVHALRHRWKSNQG